jgi:hypothetical protein
MVRYCRALGLVTALVGFLFAAAWFNQSVSIVLADTPTPTATATASPSPTPTPGFSNQIVVTMTNNTGQPAFRLFVHFFPFEGGSLTQNAPGCPSPTVTTDLSGFFTTGATMDVDWGTPCVDPGEFVKVTVQSDCFNPIPECVPHVPLYSFYSPTPTPASPTPTPDPIASQKVFCVSGTSTGVPWEWQITHGGGPTTIGPGSLGPVPSGQGGEAFAAAFAAGINAPPGVVAQQLAAPQSNCFSLQLQGTLDFEFFVRTPVGGPGPFCQVTGNPAGCPFNPTITELLGVGGAIGLLGGNDTVSAAGDQSGSGVNAAVRIGAVIVVMALTLAAVWLKGRLRT